MTKLNKEELKRLKADMNRDLKEREREREKRKLCKYPTRLRGSARKKLKIEADNAIEQTTSNGQLLVWIVERSSDFPYPLCWTAHRFLTDYIAYKIYGEVN